MTGTPNIIDFTTSPALLNLSLSPAQRRQLKAYYGLPLDKRERAIYRQCVGRPFRQRRVTDFTGIEGARSGKDSRLAAPSVIFETYTRDHSYLAPGEKAYAVIIAQDQRAGQVAFGYIRAGIENSEFLRTQVVDIRKQEIELTTNRVIAVFPCSYRAPRGITIYVAVCDEIAFWRDETSANPDTEIIRSLRRGMASVPNARLIKISTPYSKSGVLYDDYVKRHDLPETLVWQAPTSMMNPSIPKMFLERERKKDPEAYRREYLAEFTDSVSAAFRREDVEACVVVDRFEIPPQEGVKYFGAVDPSGGGPDEYALAICHQEGDKCIEDVIRGRRSAKPEQVTEEYAALLRAYRIRRVIGDKYSGAWVRESFNQFGVSYEIADLTTSEAFLELLPLVNQGSIELLDDKVQTSQLLALERRKRTSGRDQLSHPPRGHDDRCNALALAVQRVIRLRPKPGIITGRNRRDAVLNHPSWRRIDDGGRPFGG